MPYRSTTRSRSRSGRAGRRTASRSRASRACPASTRPRLGINLIDAFPFDVQISSGDVGGPSAGLMWALGLYDLLTPGDMTAGETIAGTGTIDTRGRVGPIGGIEDKVIGAERAGAAVFLVPADNMDELSDVDTGDMRLISIARFQDALDALEDLGGAGIDARPDRDVAPAAFPTACVRLGCSQQLRCVGEGTSTG